MVLVFLLVMLLLVLVLALQLLLAIVFLRLRHHWSRELATSCSTASAVIASAASGGVVQAVDNGFALLCGYPSHCKAREHERGAWRRQ